MKKLIVVTLASIITLTVINVIEGTIMNQVLSQNIYIQTFTGEEARAILKKLHVFVLLSFGYEKMNGGSSKNGVGTGR